MTFDKFFLLSSVGDTIGNEIRVNMRADYPCAVYRSFRNTDDNDKLSSATTIQSFRSHVIERSQTPLSPINCFNGSEVTVHLKVRSASILA
jgi:hypothetical protein